MPDALSILLNSPGRSNMTPGGPNVPTYTPNISRNNAKVGLLRKFLGLGEDDGGISQADLESTYSDVQAEQDADEAKKAQAAQALETMKGEYGLEGERIKGRSSLEAAKFNREASSNDKAAAFAQQEFLTRLRGDQTAANAEATQSHIDSRGQSTANGQMERMRLADKLRQAAELRKQAAGVNPLLNMFTGRREKLTQQAQELSQGSDPIQAYASQIESNPKLQGKTFEEIVAIAQPESDEDMQHLQQAYQLVHGGQQ